MSDPTGHVFTDSCKWVDGEQLLVLNVVDPSAERLATVGLAKPKSDHANLFPALESRA